MTAEDIASQVFLKAWENLDRYQIGKSPFIAWLYTIARNQVIDHYRTFKDTVQLDEALQIADDERPPDDEVQASFDIEVIRDLLRKGAKLIPDKVIRWTSFTDLTIFFQIMVFLHACRMAVRLCI